MFVWSLKFSTIKLVGIIVISAVALAILIGIIPAFSPATVESGIATLNPKYVFDGIKDTNDAAEFAKQFELKLKTPELEQVDLKVPPKFDIVLEKYNDIQKKQGFDLEKYKNKDITRYTYALLDEEGNDTDKKLSLLVCKDTVIGGDICSDSDGGFVNGFIS